MANDLSRRLKQPPAHGLHLRTLTGCREHRSRRRWNCGRRRCVT
jgi:hypothetical protein